MARPKKKNSDPKMSMEQLLNRAVTLFQEPYDDRDERELDNLATNEPAIRNRGSQGSEVS